MENNNQEINNTEATENQEVETGSAQDNEKLITAEVDRRVNQALQKAKAKWEKEVGTRIDTHLKDFEKKAQMTPEELKQLDLEEKFKMLEKKEKEYARITREVEISNKLSSKKLSTLLTKFVYSDDMEEVEQNIATLEQLVLGMVNEQVEARIGSTKPTVSNKEKLDKEAFRKLSLAEQQDIYKNDPDLFNKLTNKN